VLEEAEEDLLAVDGFPTDHWAKLRSTNPLERVNRKKRGVDLGSRSCVAHVSMADVSHVTLGSPLTHRRPNTGPT
jgi:hypothetical protein